MQTYTLPPFAEEHIKTLQAQMSGLQMQLQAFVDGVLCGMGADMQAQIDVDLQKFTATVTPKGEAETPPLLEGIVIDESKS